MVMIKAGICSISQSRASFCTCQTKNVGSRVSRVRARHRCVPRIVELYSQWFCMHVHNLHLPATMDGRDVAQSSNTSTAAPFRAPPRAADGLALTSRMSMSSSGSRVGHTPRANCRTFCWTRTDERFYFFPSKACASLRALGTSLTELVIWHMSKLPDTFRFPQPRIFDHVSLQRAVRKKSPPPCSCALLHTCTALSAPGERLAGNPDADCGLSDSWPHCYHPLGHKRPAEVRENGTLVSTLVTLPMTRASTAKSVPSFRW